MLLAFAAACKMNLTTDVYPTDLWDAVAGFEGLTAPTTMAFQVPNADDCNEHAVQISEIMFGIVEDFSPKGCGDEGMESFLFADTQVPVVSSVLAWKNTDALFGILVIPNNDGIRVALYMNMYKYGILTDRMEDEFLGVDLDTSALMIVLNNDSRDTIEFSVSDVFVNGEPVLGTANYELPRRYKAEIKVSDVATAYLARHGFLGEIFLWKES